MKSKLVVAILLFSTPALAEEGSSSISASADSSSLLDRISLGAFLGGNYLSSQNELGNSFADDQVPGSAFLFGFRGGYRLLDSFAKLGPITPSLHLEAEAKLAFSSTDAADGRPSEAAPVLGWRANAVIDLTSGNKLTPFALVGMGGETVFGSNRFMHTPDTDFATYYGGGVRYALRPKVELRSDLRLGATASRDNALSLLGEFHVGISFQLGSTDEEPKNEVSEFRSEPDPLPVETQRADSDGDGIADDEDACPKLPEIRNGIDDTDGCPEEDSDKDGLLGTRDSCPDAAEDPDGFEDDDGCPDPDNDKDGRADVIDSCPQAPETINGFEDDDGCPDEVPEQVAKFTGTIEGIQFKSGSARILRSSKKTLNAAYEVLKGNPSIRIEISGHTDNKGKDETNRSLSRKRADYVKWYLVDKGINADRIETVGHGPDKPKAENSKASGRKINRRIEFKLLTGAAPVPAAADESKKSDAAATPKKP